MCTAQFIEAKSTMNSPSPDDQLFRFLASEDVTGLRVVSGQRRDLIACLATASWEAALALSQSDPGEARRCIRDRPARWQHPTPCQFSLPGSANSANMRIAAAEAPNAAPETSNACMESADSLCAGLAMILTRKPRFRLQPSGFRKQRVSNQSNISGPGLLDVERVKPVEPGMSADRYLSKSPSGDFRPDCKVF
jgi:hypothetical protein